MNDLAARYLMLSPSGIWGVNLLVIAVGAVLAAITWRGKGRLRRATYFLWSSALMLGLAIAQLYWIEAPQGLATGYVGTILAVSIAAFLMFGYAHWIIAAARSRDIKGDASSAILGFIPIVNFYLLFSRGRPTNGEGIQTPRSAFGRFIGDPVLVILAILLFVFANGLTKMMTESLADGSRWVEDPRTQLAFAKGAGTPAYFEWTAKQTRPFLPQRLDDITEWVHIAAQGDELIYLYQVDTDSAVLPEALGDHLAETVCAPDNMGEILRVGGRVTFDYVSLGDGRKLLHRTVTSADCANP